MTGIDVCLTRIVIWIHCDQKGSWKFRRKKIKKRSDFLKPQTGLLWQPWKPPRNWKKHWVFSSIAAWLRNPILPRYNNHGNYTHKIWSKKNKQLKIMMNWFSVSFPEFRLAVKKNRKFRNWLIAKSSTVGSVCDKTRILVLKLIYVKSINQNVHAYYMHH